MNKKILLITVFTLLVIILASCGKTQTTSSSGGSDAPAKEEPQTTNEDSAPNPLLPFVGGKRIDYANCNVLEDAILRESCLGGVAIEFNDLDKCLTLSDSIRMSCVTGIASKRNDISICAKLSTSQDRDFCRIGFNSEVGF